MKVKTLSDYVQGGLWLFGETVF